MCSGSLPKRISVRPGFREDFPERATLMLNPTEIVGLSKADRGRGRAGGSIQPSREHPEDSEQ